jgi:hypothetical protein
MKEKSKPVPVSQEGDATDCKHSRNMACRSSLRRCLLKPRMRQVGSTVNSRRYRGGGIGIISRTL